MDEQLRILALAKRILRGNHVDESRSFESVMRTIQLKIRKEKSESIVQTTMNQFRNSEICHTCTVFCAIFGTSRYLGKNRSTTFVPVNGILLYSRIKKTSNASISKTVDLDVDEPLVPRLALIMAPLVRTSHRGSDNRLDRGRILSRRL